MKFRKDLATICENDPLREWHVVVNDSNLINYEFVVGEIKFYKVLVRSLIIQSFNAPNNSKTKWTDVLKASQILFNENPHFKDFYYSCGHSTYVNEISLQQIFGKCIPGATAAQLENLGFQMPMRMFPPNFPPKFFGKTVN